MRHETKAALALTVALAACSAEDTVSPIDRLPRELSVAERDIIRSGNEFGLELFREVHAREDASLNVFVSPLSAHMALGMTLNGATADTWDAMRSTLGFGGMQEAEINASFRELTALLLGLDPRVEIAIANSFWYRDTFAVLQSFRDVLRKDFDAVAAALDFDDPQAPATINRWVRENTGNRIDEIIDEIGSDVVAYLINAVYFKAKWTERFEKDDTRAGTFRRADGSTVQVPFMNRTGRMDVLNNELFSAVDLGYGGGAWRMTVLVPREDVGIQGVLDRLTAERWDEWTAAFQPVTGYGLSLPRFTLEYETILNEPLTAMGMGIAFSERLASFERIAPAPPDLYLSEVKQKTFVQVDEEGTEAAAVTSVEVSVTSAGPQLVVDRPFIVAIRERLSGTLLFIGAIGDPSAG